MGFTKDALSTENVFDLWKNILRKISATLR